MLAEKQDLVEQIAAALSNDTRTKAAVIEILDRNGIITLLGEVETDEVRRAAEQIARNHPGVVAVMNELFVTNSRR